MYLGFSQDKRLKVSTKFRKGATYNKVLLLVADLDSVYGIGREGTVWFPLILYKMKGKKTKQKVKMSQY